MSGIWPTLKSPYLLRLTKPCRTSRLLYVSYYSSHEPKMSIYLAKLKITPSLTDAPALTDYH